MHLRARPAVRSLSLDALRLLALALLLCVLPGCLTEQSFPMRPQGLVRMAPGTSLSARQWARDMHALAASRLPPGKREALTTEELVDHVRPRDIWRYFDLNPTELDSLVGNYSGIEQTAQVTSPPPVLRKGHFTRTSWPGFIDVEVPAHAGAALSARLGAPDSQRDLGNSFIIITHGLFGSCDGYGMRNLALALQSQGHHVLALDMRGHGATLARHPEYAISFGILESGDLLAAARWLKREHRAARVGLLCYSLTAYEAILTAWLDGRAPVTEFLSAPLLADLPQWQPEPAFNAGVLALSAPPGIIDVANGFDRRRTMIEAPVKATFQHNVTSRLAFFDQPPGYTIWDLVRSELSRGEYQPRTGDIDGIPDDLLSFLDFSANDWAVGAERLNRIRVPLLVMNAANDPLATAQGVADLFSRQSNPNIGVILLRHGGHMGFTALGADYFYSMTLNFFDPRTGPVAR